MQKIFFAAALLIAFIDFIAKAEASPAVLGDRIIIEVNNTPYTQRQMELYSLVKQLLLPNDRPLVLANADTWEGILNDFEDDVVVELEALRLGSFNPSDAAVAKAEEVLNKKITASADARAAREKLKMDRKTSMRVLTSVMRVEAFARSKQKQTSLMNSVLSEEDAPPVTSSGDWRKDLKARAVSRYFKDAKSYVSISPP